MYTIHIKNYKKKIIILSIILAIYFSYFLFSNMFTTKTPVFDITIDNYITFSYPSNFNLSAIYTGKALGYDFIPANSQNDSFIHKTVDDKFTFSYPSIFNAQEEKFEGSEITYHIRLFEKDGSSHGFIQVWNLPHPLSDFLKQSEKTSLATYEKFVSKPIVVNSNNGYHWEYEIKTSSSELLKGNEVFIQKDDTMYRISYFVPLAKWTSNKSDIFWKIVNSVKIT